MKEDKISNFKEEIIKELEKNQQWGIQAKIRREFCIKQHIISKLVNVMRARKKMRELYFKEE